VNKTKLTERFNPEKYGMIFCPDCKGLGKSLYATNWAIVCKGCGGFGLIKREENSFGYSDYGPAVLTNL
jgi:hypothetical protein